MKDSKLNRIVFSACLSIEFCLLFFITVHFEKIQNELLAILLSLTVVIIVGLIIQHFVPIKTTKRKIVFFSFIPLSFLVLYISAFCFYNIDYAVWENIDNNSDRQMIDCGKEYMFADKRVMVFVPHQDDDVLLMGGVIEQYVKYDSEVTFVFSSTGDQGTSDSKIEAGQELGKTRIDEAVNVLANYGIPEDNVFFLGFGDGYNGKHLYNYSDTPNQTVESRSGSSTSYGSEKHPAYNEGELLTKNNFINDIKSLVLEHKPDIVFCIDYDSHPDHRALSLSVEEAMGDVCKSVEDYRPIVFKGFAYSTALKAVDDYYLSPNIMSTVNPYETEFMRETNVYLWNDRIRFPVSIQSLTHYYSNSTTDKNLLLYRTQHGTVFLKAKAAINSDKVFWERRTDSLLFDADISTSSGKANTLTDFKLFDCSGINQEVTEFSNNENIWFPSNEDDSRTITVKFNEAKNISSIVLYDNPSLSDNINNATILFDDGSIVETGDLAPNGSATKILISKNNVHRFAIIIKEVTGDNPGLCEIEAFDSNVNHNMGFIKLMDDKENFVYDYIFENCDENCFCLYNYGYDKPLNYNNFTIELSNCEVSAKIEDEKIIVACPQGCEAILTIKSKDGKVSDTIKVSNPSNYWFSRIGIWLSEYYQNNLVFGKQIEYASRFMQGLGEIFTRIVN